MLATLSEVLAIGKKKGIAIGAFNTPNLECLLAVVECAEELGVPVIVAHAELHESIAPLSEIGPVMLAIAKASKTKVCVHLDHGENYEYCARAIDMGFTSVMIDASTKPFKENIAITKRVVDYAHEHGVSVEAELGKLPTREGGGDNGSPCDLYTNPADVVPFIKATGVDALAIAFGTAHGIYKVKPVLNLDIINAVRAETGTFLVMHGGSGISPEIYRDVIKRGINKINYYTYMSYAGFAEAKAYLEGKESGFYHDVAFAVKEAMKKNAMAAMMVFSGK